MGPDTLTRATEKLNQQLRAQWELSVDTTEDHSLKEFTVFLTKFCKSAMTDQFCI